MRDIRTADQLRRLVLEETRSRVECSNLSDVVVKALDRKKFGISWTATEIPGSQTSAGSQRVLREIVMKLARNYELKSD